MSTTSQKHRNFVAEPIGQKSVRELAGIGAVLGGRLEQIGIDKVRSFNLSRFHLTICSINKGLRCSGTVPDTKEKCRIFHGLVKRCL